MKDPNDSVELGAVEDHGGILTIRGGGNKRNWNNIQYKQGMSAKNVGSTKLSCNINVMFVVLFNVFFIL